MEQHTDTSDFVGKYINPFTDFGFKKIFGEEPNKDLLIDFLNELLRPQNHQIKTLTYQKTERLGTTDLDRNVVFDLYCESEQGEKFIVEMQKAKQSFFKDRTVFYSTFPIQEQAPKGVWNYQLKSVFAIGVLDFTFDDKDKDKTVVNRVQLVDHNTQRVFYDKLTYVFVQMPNFDKSIDELQTHLDKWLYVLKYMEKLDRIPEKIKEKIFEKVFHIAEYQKLTKSERTAYEDSLKYYRDLKNSLDTAREEGKKEAEDILLQQIENEKLLKEAAQARAEQEQKEKEEERRQKEEAQAKAETERKEKEEAQAKAETERKEKEEAQAKAEEVVTKLHRTVHRVYGKNMPISEIAENMDISESEVRKIVGL